MKQFIPVASFAWLIIFVLFAVSPTPAQSKADPLAEVKAALDTQVAAWNSGASQPGSSVYFDSPEMLWVNRTGVRKGNAPIQASYRRTAASTNPAPAGVYSYEPLHMERLAPNCVYFVMRWKYEMNGRPPQTGVTSLVWKKINKKWVIVAEHAS